MVGRRARRGAVVAVVVAAALAADGAAGAADGTLDRTLEAAAGAVAQGDDVRARTLLEEAAGHAPDQPGVFLALARLHLRDGDLAAAEAAASRAIALQPTNGAALAVLGDVLRAAGRLEEAGRAYDAAIAADPTDSLARGGRARLHLADGDLDAAALIVPADESSLSLRLAWADAAADAGDLAAAIAKLDGALERNPGWMEALLRRGDYARRLGRTAEAHRDLETAVRLDPLSAEAHYRRGLLRRDLHDVRGAMADFGRAIALDAGFAPAYVARGSVYQAAGQQATALRDFDRALALDRANGDALTHKATSECAQGAFDRCLEASAVALDASPGDWRAQVAKGHALLGLDDVEAAVDAYATALTLIAADETPWLLARLQRHLLPRLADPSTFAMRFVAAQTPEEVARLIEARRQR